MATAETEAAKLRETVSRGDFAGAETAVRRYADAVRLLVERLPAAEGSAQLLAACDVVEASRTSLATARARVAEEVCRLQSVGRYAGAPEPVHRVRVVG